MVHLLGEKLDRRKARDVKLLGNLRNAGGGRVELGQEHPGDRGLLLLCPESYAAVLISVKLGDDDVLVVLKVGTELKKVKFVMKGN